MSLSSNDVERVRCETLSNWVPAGTKKLRTMSFSLKGSQPWAQGFDTSAQILTNGEPIGLQKQGQLQVIIDNITSIKHGNIYCEEPKQTRANKLSWSSFHLIISLFESCPVFVEIYRIYMYLSRSHLQVVATY